MTKNKASKHPEDRPELRLNSSINRTDDIITEWKKANQERTLAFFSAKEVCCSFAVFLWRIHGAAIKIHSQVKLKGN